MTFVCESNVIFSEIDKLGKLLGKVTDESCETDDNYDNDYSSLDEVKVPPTRKRSYIQRRNSDSFSSDDDNTTQLSRIKGQVYINKTISFSPKNENNSK